MTIGPRRTPGGSAQITQQLAVAQKIARAFAGELARQRSVRDFSSDDVRVDEGAHADAPNSLSGRPASESSKARAA
jgi:hypothetical protein